MPETEPRTNQEIVARILILKNGARHLRDFGYPNVEPHEIMKVPAYKLMFRGWLEETVRDIPDDMADTKALIETMIEETYA